MQTLEHELELAQCRLMVDKAARGEFEAEANQKEQLFTVDLQEPHTKVSTLSQKFKDVRNQLTLLTKEFMASDKRDIKVEE